MPLTDADIAKIADAVWEHALKGADDRHASNVLVKIYSALKAKGWIS